MKKSEHLSAVVPAESRGKRLDQVLAELFTGYSRTRLQQWIRDGYVVVNGRQPRAREKVMGGERIEVQAELEAETPWQGEHIPLDVIHADAAILVVNKPPGMVVHPAAGNREGTLVNALLYFDPGLESVPRAGVVHRLDKDTSGLLVIARTLSSHKNLVEQLQARTVQRQYEAVVQGVMTAGGTVEAPVGRHPVERKRMAVVKGGREAVSHFRVVERFRAHTHIRVNLETGRTHQIRVHMAHLRHPLVGDPVYGGRLRIPPACTDELTACLRGFRRQALHAASLCLDHPESKERLCWEAPLPDDMQRLLAALREDAHGR